MQILQLPSSDKNVRMTGYTGSDASQIRLPVPVRATSCLGAIKNIPKVQMSYTRYATSRIHEKDNEG